jgi:omega-6 fatty acid desaturase (delta-12 desaturase)
MHENDNKIPMSAANPLDQPVMPSSISAWKAAVRDFQHSSAGHAAWQLVNSVGGFTALWVLMYFTVQWSWWLTVPLAVLAGGLLIRIFIIFHDCGHGSFLRSKRTNRIIGFVCGLLTFTPYERWTWEHARHHARSGNLDHRGIGDIWTLTVEEYLALSRWQRLRYRMARHPLLFLGFGPFFLMLFKERLPYNCGDARERRSVWWMNAAVLAMVLALGSLFGWINYVVIQLIILWVGGVAGVWLFYVQHQYEGVYWARGKGWNYTDAALQGSSYYRLPRVLQWFTGNIGFHHIHHLSPRVPNYHLQRCHEANELFQQVPELTLRASAKTLSLRLWDETTGRLVGFRHLLALRAGNQG